MLWEPLAWITAIHVLYVGLPLKVVSMLQTGVSGCGLPHGRNRFALGSRRLFPGRKGTGDRRLPLGPPQSPVNYLLKS